MNSVQFSLSAVFNSLRPHEPQHVRPPCPSPTPGVHPNPCPLSWWCHPTILSSVVPFHSCPQSFPASDLFQWISSSHQVAKVLALQLQHQSFQWGWFPLGWTGLISLMSKRLSRVFSSTSQFFGTQPSLKMSRKTSFKTSAKGREMEYHRDKRQEDF